MWLRLAIWIPLVAIALGYRWWHDRSVSANAEAVHADAPAANGWRERRATMAEWNRPIAELGRDRQAKRLIWRGLGPEPLAARGALVWWQDGEQERVTYLAAADEDPTVGLDLIVALLDRRAVLFDLHGDPGLIDRLGDLSAGDGLPPGWEILLPPAGAATTP